jgi:hypothetical protein
LGRNERGISTAKRVGPWDFYAYLRGHLLYQSIAFIRIKEIYGIPVALAYLLHVGRGRWCLVTSVLAVSHLFGRLIVNTPGLSPSHLSCSFLKIEYGAPEFTSRAFVCAEFIISTY